MPTTESRKRKIQYGHQAAILKMMLLIINRLLPIYISIVPLKFEVDIRSQSKSLETKKPNMAARRPFWKWSRWKSIGFCLWPPSTCIWNLILKFQNKLDFCSGNPVVYRQTNGQTDGRTRWIQYTPPLTSLGRGIKNWSSDRSHFSLNCPTGQLQISHSFALFASKDKYGNVGGQVNLHSHLPDRTGNTKVKIEPCNF